MQVAEFSGCIAVRFGFPNDEALGGHALWKHGLDFYAAHEVTGSLWLEQLRAIERHHPQAPTKPFPTARHFLLTFKESTLEAVAEGITLVSQHELMKDAVKFMAEASSA